MAGTSEEIERLVYTQVPFSVYTGQGKQISWGTEEEMEWYGDGGLKEVLPAGGLEGDNPE